MQTPESKHYIVKGFDNNLVGNGLKTHKIPGENILEFNVAYEIWVTIYIFISTQIDAPYCESIYLYTWHS